MTLFWKLFFPIFYATFFGLFIVAAFTVEPDDLPLLTNSVSKIVLVTCYTLFMGIMWFTIIDLKRVEADDEFIYVTNYFKAFRYKKSDIASVSSMDLGIFTWNTYTMKDKTTLGKRIRFIGNAAVLKK
ncbi:MAG: hypothetical protein IPN29_16060 [Saprospiraceae bacterium]|nr:hypothetical protein [Saprospiraceae bacterium]